MEIEIKNLPKMRVAGFRHVGPYNEIGAAFGRLGEWVGKTGIQPKGMIGIYHDDPMEVAPERLRSDALAVVDDAFTTTDEGVQVYDIDANTYAAYTYRGDYSGLPAAWGRFMGEWFPSSGQQFGRGSFMEWYLDDCSVVPAEECRTVLYAPVKRA